MIYILFIDMFSNHFQNIGSGFVIAPLIGLVETIAIGKAFGRFRWNFCILHGFGTKSNVIFQFI